MGNQLFREASKWVNEATNRNADPEVIAKAKNALSSAYANSNNAEKQQLRDLQDQLEQMKS